MSDDYRDEIKKLPKVVRPISDEELASFDIAEILGTKKAAKIERTSPEKIEMPIQVVRGNIQYNGNFRPERYCPLKLKRAYLQDNESIFAYTPDFTG